MFNFKKDKSKIYLTIILIVGFLVYFNSLHSDFLWNDKEQVVNNLLIRSGDNIPLFFKSSTFYYGGDNLSGGFYRPLVTLSYFLNYSFWELNPLGFHLYQVFFHLMNLSLIFFIVEEILKRQKIKNSKDISFLSSLLFAVHPANVESVVYIGSIGEIFYSFFALLAFYFLLKGINYKKRIIENKNLIIVFFLMFLSLLSKESGILTFPLFLLYLFLFVKPKKETYNKFFLGSGIILSLYLFLRFFIAEISTADFRHTPIGEASFWERIATLPYTVFNYLRIIFFPKNLFIGRHFVVSSFSDIRFWLPFIVLSGFIFYILWTFIRKKMTTSLFFLLWFLGCLFPTLNIIPLDVTMAERWLYFPLIGLIVLIVLLIFKTEIKKEYIFSIFLLIIIIFSLRTIIRNKDWENGLTLFKNDIKYNDNAFDLENNYGVELFRIGEIEKAKTHFEKSVSLQSNWTISHSNLGAAYQRQGNLEKAKEEYYKSLEYGDYRLAYENLSTILLIEKKNKEALKVLEDAFQIYSRSDTIKKLLAIAYYRNGEIGNAINLLSVILQEHPQDQEANYLLWAVKNKKEIQLSK